MRQLGWLLVGSSIAACAASHPAVVARPKDRRPDVEVVGPTQPTPTPTDAGPDAQPDRAPAAAVVAVPAMPCWDGTGPAIEGDTTELMSGPTLAKGYPAIVKVPDAKERARRATVLAARNHGVTFTLSEGGDVTQIVSERMSCASAAALKAPRATGKVPRPAPDDGALLEQLRSRNADVLATATLAITGFVQAPDGSWRLQIANGAPASYQRLAASLRAPVLSDARVLAAFNKVSRLERVREIKGDSCGPECGPPPSMTTVLGARSITAADADVMRYTAVFTDPRGLVVRKVAGLQLKQPGTRLAGGVTLIDAVTGDKISAEPYDMFE